MQMVETYTEWASSHLGADFPTLWRAGYVAKYGESCPRDYICKGNQLAGSGDYVSVSRLDLLDVRLDPSYRA